MSRVIIQIPYDRDNSEFWEARLSYYAAVKKYISYQVTMMLCYEFKWVDFTPKFWDVAEFKFEGLSYYLRRYHNKGSFHATFKIC